MNAKTPFEPYRVILDYEALEDMFLDRIEDLNTTYTQIDEAGGLTRGETQKLLSKSRERWARTIGITSMGKILKGTGIVLVAVVDDERFAAIKAELVARKRPRQPPNGSSTRPTWLFTRKMSRKMQALRLTKLSPAQRKKIARKAGKASGKARRAKARASRSLVQQPAPKLDVALPSRLVDADPARTTPSAHEMA